LHLTEYAHSRQLNFADPVVRRFADVFHHRMLRLFYRAWADARPALSYDRTEPRRFDVYVGSLLGLGAPDLRGHDAVPDGARLALAGRLALGSRPAEGLVGILEEFFGFEFAVRELVGEWLKVPEENRLVLGGEGATLGEGTVLGRTVFGRQHCFQLVCGPLGYDELERLLPGSASLARLRD